MGDIADAMLSGELCEQCGCPIHYRRGEGPPGYPQVCSRCRGEVDNWNPPGHGSKKTKKRNAARKRKRARDRAALNQ